jgi:hypothetical protein
MTTALIAIAVLALVIALGDYFIAVILVHYVGRIADWWRRR